MPWSINCLININILVIRVLRLRAPTLYQSQEWAQKNVLSRCQSSDWEEGSLQVSLCISTAFVSTLIRTFTRTSAFVSGPHMLLSVVCMLLSSYCFCCCSCCCYCCFCCYYSCMMFLVHAEAVAWCHYSLQKYRSILLRLISLSAFIYINYFICIRSSSIGSKLVNS